VDSEYVRLSGVDRKWLADLRNGAVDPEPTVDQPSAAQSFARTAEEFDTAFASAAVPALSRIFALAVEYAAALDAAGIQGIDS
jgi:hypothetical protein